MNSTQKIFHVSRATVVICVVLALLHSCTSETEDKNAKKPIFENDLITAKLNLNEGYSINQCSGDSVDIFVNSSGDSVNSGVKYEVSAKFVADSAYNEPLEIVLDTSLKTVFRNRTYFTDEVIPSIPLNIADLPPFSTENSESDFVLVNLLGDTIPTGVTLKIEPEVIELILPDRIDGMLPNTAEFSNLGLLKLGENEGLPSTKISSTIEDDNGNIWMSTLGFGVCIYDGIGYRFLNESHGLREVWILDLYKDSKGNIWILTSGGGISMYDGKYLKNYGAKEGLGSSVFFRAREDAKGNMWLASGGGGLVCLTESTFIHYTTNEGFGGNYAISVDIATNGEIWAGAFESPISVFDGHSFRHIGNEEGFLGDNGWSISCMPNGDVWIGSNGGLMKFRDDVLFQYTDELGLSNVECTDIIQDNQGDIWVAHNMHGLNRLVFDSEQAAYYFEYYGVSTGLTSDSFWHLRVDEHDNLWAPTLGGGLNILSINGFKHYGERNGLSLDQVGAFIEDGAGNFWFGTLGGGCDIIKRNERRYINEVNGDPGNFARAMAVDWNGEVWWAMDEQGLSHLVGDKIYNYSMESGLSHDICVSLLIDRNNKVWVGTLGGGITLLDGENIYHITEKEGLPSDFIVSLMEDQYGNVWIGGRGGLSVYDGTEIINYTEKEGLSNYGVNSLLEDSQGRIWIGTNAGINILDENEITYITTEDGLGDPAVHSLMEDEEGRIWVGTQQGLNFITPKAQNEFQINLFSKEDGLAGEELIMNSAYIDSKNNAWWGSSRGVSQIALSEIVIAENPPNVLLTGVNIGGEKCSFKDLQGADSLGFYFDDYDQVFGIPTGLVLDYDKNHLTFEFRATDWAAPHKIQYSYKLVGLEDQWSQPTRDIKADYRGLNYGEYSFLVSAIGESQEWSEPAAFHFTVLPPWWHSWWARTLYVLFGALGIWLFIKWRTKKFKQNEEKLKYEIAMATIEIREQKEEVEHQKELIEESHKEITDSISYAKRLQDAILPSFEQLDEHIPDNFILFKPKDVVSGDFYWFENVNGTSYLAAADCTGHGVPGAMVSVVCSNALNRAVNEFGISEPSKILDKARELVIKRFAKSGEGVKDGMDIALCAVNENKLIFAGANNPIWIVRKTELLTAEQKEQKSSLIEDDLSLIEYKADKQPVGLYAGMKDFTQQTIKMYPGDTFYLFSDGFADQFGGPHGKKFKYKPFKRFLIELNRSTDQGQAAAIEKAFEDWRGQHEQVDDVVVIGVRI